MQNSQTAVSWSVAVLILARGMQGTDIAVSLDGPIVEPAPGSLSPNTGSEQLPVAYSPSMGCPCSSQTRPFLSQRSSPLVPFGVQVSRINLQSTAGRFTERCEVWIWFYSGIAVSGRAELANRCQLVSCCADPCPRHAGH